jgi:TetR/AcrR family transcriptional regulator, cholesterol catabolism regulator
VTVAPEPLSRSQSARRARVLAAAMELGATGGYDAVQMRDVAQTAGVALGTIYRYFPSKDALLAAAMLAWMEDLEARVGKRAPAGETTAARVFDVLRRAVATIERQPQLAEAVITALTSDDPGSGTASLSTTDVMNRVMLSAFPEGPTRTWRHPSPGSSAMSGSPAWWRGRTAWATWTGWPTSWSAPPTCSATAWADRNVRARHGQS